jgi:hypothetical protein
MPDFTFLYRGRADSIGSPEQRQQHLAKWRAWFQELGQGHHLKELGHPLDPAGMVVRGSNKTVIDGPFAEVKDIIGGFSIVEAHGLAQAVELAKGCPILEVGGSVEVRPVQQLSM